MGMASLCLRVHVRPRGVWALFYRQAFARTGKISTQASAARVDASLSTSPSESAHRQAPHFGPESQDARNISLRTAEFIQNLEHFPGRALSWRPPHTMQDISHETSKTRRAFC